jgi:hypothetical protein
MQGGYAQSNRFAGLATNKDSDNDTVDTITRTINLHMANLTAQTTSQMGTHRQTPYHKIPLSRVSQQVEKSYLVTLDSQSNKDSYIT